MTTPTHKLLREDGDNYKDTIYAIVGFVNLFIYDDMTKTMRKEILPFQGSKLYISSDEVSEEKEKKNNGEFITPDIGIVLSEDYGIIGEVKSTFPKNNEHWKDDFTQLKKYDQELEGWPSPSGKVKAFDVVLLTHYSRSVAVKKYYQENAEFELIHPFAIIEYNRFTQSKEFFSLRIQMGNISESTVNKRLEEGIPIPMNVFIKEYSRYKLYDAKPPLPYLLEVIWTNIVALKASENPKFSVLRSNQKIEVEFELNELTELLCTQFTFYQLSASRPELQNYYKLQPKYPKHSWIVEACKKLIETGDAAWKDESAQVVVFYFKRREDIYDYFLNICATSENKNQLDLFTKKLND